MTEDSASIPIVIFKVAGNLGPRATRDLKSLERGTGEVIGYGGGYDTVWKTIVLNDGEKLGELLEYLENNKVEYMIPENVKQPCLGA